MYIYVYIYIYIYIYVRSTFVATQFIHGVVQKKHRVAEKLWYQKTSRDASPDLSDKPKINIKTKVFSESLGWNDW
jgi:hypothetical protein